MDYRAHNNHLHSPVDHHPNMLRNTALQNENAYSYAGGWEDAGAGGWQDAGGLLTAETSGHNGSSGNSSSVGGGQQVAAAQDAAIVSALASRVRKRVFKHSAADGIALAEEAKLDKIIDILTDPDDRTSKKLKSWMVDDSQDSAVALKQLMKSTAVRERK
jgi:hypothetical protein